MYAETDFLLALVKDEDWLGERAEAVYRDHGDDLWTSRLTLVELLLVADREGMDAERDGNHLARVDVDTGDARRWEEPGTFVEEPVPVDGPDGERVVLATALDVDAGRTDLLVFDADLELLARAHLPHAVPFGFHGRFFGNGED